MTRVTLLGPQRRPSVQHIARDLESDTSFAVVTAGWQERESEDAELSQLLGGRVVNLDLHRRWLQVLDSDPEYATAEREHEAALAELRQLYLLRLDHALRATYSIARLKEGRRSLRERALADTVELVRLIDERHLLQVRQIRHAFFEAWPPHERPTVSAHRAEVCDLLAGAQALVVAGGHVGELVKVLHLFHVSPHIPDTVIAWSAGAMALTERVVIFHDYVPHGVAHTEVLDVGIGLTRDLVLLPHARRRLRVEDPLRMSVLAQRFDPHRCLVLDDGVRIDLTDEGRLPPDARIVAADGRIAPMGVA